MAEENEFEINQFAYYIEVHNRERIEDIIKKGLKFKGHTPLMIAGMHTNGTWVLKDFGKKPQIDEASTESLRELANTLALDVDEDILDDLNFTRTAT